MAKPRKRYVCQACGSLSSRWQGQCADCAEWNSLVQETAAVSSIFAAKHNLRGGGRTIELVGLDSEVALPARFATEIAEFDRAIGRGLVAGPPALLVIDSIQTMHSDLIEGAPGTVSQVRALAQELERFAKE